MVGGFLVQSNVGDWGVGQSMGPTLLPPQVPEQVLVSTRPSLSEWVRMTVPSSKTSSSTLSPLPAAAVATLTTFDTFGLLMVLHGRGPLKDIVPAEGINAWPGVLRDGDELGTGISRI
jgi:hypothetical protein